MFDQFKLTDAEGAVLEIRDLKNLELKGDNRQTFDTVREETVKHKVIRVFTDEGSLSCLSLHPGSRPKGRSQGLTTATISWRQHVATTFTHRETSHQGGIAATGSNKGDAQEEKIAAATTTVHRGRPESLRHRSPSPRGTTRAQCPSCRFGRMPCFNQKMGTCQKEKKCDCWQFLACVHVTKGKLKWRNFIIQEHLLQMTVLNLWILKESKEISIVIESRRRFRSRDKIWKTQPSASDIPLSTGFGRWSTLTSNQALGSSAKDVLQVNPLEASQRVFFFSKQKRRRKMSTIQIFSDQCCSSTRRRVDDSPAVILGTDMRRHRVLIYLRDGTDDRREMESRLRVATTTMSQLWR